MNLLCLQTILNSKPEGDCLVNNLRRRGQSLCDHADTDEGRKVHAQKAVRDAEEQWRTVLLAAKHVEAAAEAEINQRIANRELEVRTNLHRQGQYHCHTEIVCVKTLFYFQINCSHLQFQMV